MLYPTLNLIEVDKKRGNELTIWKTLSSNRTHQLEVLNTQCHATWSYQFSHLFQPTYAGGPCDVSVVGLPLFSMPLAFPVNPQMAATFNYHLLTTINDGSWRELKSKYMPSTSCGDHRLDTAEIGTPSVSLPFSSFIGPIMFVGVALIVATFIKLVGSLSAKHVQAHRQATTDSQKTFVTSHDLAQKLEQIEMQPEQEDA